MSSKPFISALGFNGLTKRYDLLLWTTFPERKIKKALIEQLQLKGNETLLDFGCGTGTLAIMIKEQYPTVNILGIDVDDNVISIAEHKIKTKGLNIPIKRFDGQNLSFAGHQQFDKIVSSFVFHHIPTALKRTLFAQLYRIIKPGGEFYVADFGKLKNFNTKVAFNFFRRVDGKDNTQINAEGLLPEFIKGGGFDDVQILSSYNTLFGTVDLIKATDKQATLRKIKFAKHQNGHFRMWATNLRDVVWNSIEERLEQRNKKFLICNPIMIFLFLSLMLMLLEISFTQ